DLEKPGAKFATMEIDPFEVVVAQSSEELAPVRGESTSFFIARAGMHRRNSPLKIAGWVGGAVALIALAIFGVLRFPSVRAAVGGRRGAPPPAGLTNGKVVKTTPLAQKAFESCIMEALRRDPNFKGGKIHITITVNPSGVVSSPSIAPRHFDKADIGQCIKE